MRLMLCTLKVSVSHHKVPFAWTDIIEGAVAQWCNPLTLKPEQSGGVG